MDFLKHARQKFWDRPPEPPGPIVLDRGRIFILPSPAGLLFALALLVMLIGAINYNLALGHALVFLLAGIGLSGMVHTVRNLHGLRIMPGRADPVFAGEHAHFEFLIEETRGRTRQSLMLAAQADQAVTFTVNTGNSTKINLPCPATRRGWLALPKIRLSTVYPLGLFLAWSYLRPTMHCLVYPRPLATPLPLQIAALPATERQGSSGQDDFAGFRVRQPADSLQHVAWKASARDDGQRPLLIKQFAGGGQQGAHFDWSDCAPSAPPETRISMLCGWILEAERQGLNYSLALPGQAVISPGHGDGHRHRCLEALALFQP